MTPRLSIVIPFYNVEKYIAECLDSVYQQDIPEDEYEVICVNDASPDHSRDIVLEYQRKHSNLVLVEHEVNKKLGAARNTGRRIAKGEYLWNVDSDDMIAPNCLKEILETCETNDLDVLIFEKYYFLDDEPWRYKKSAWSNTEVVFTGYEFFNQMTGHLKEISQVWTQVYSRNYLDENNIYSPEINMGEDVPYTFKSILCAHKIMARHRPYYVYRNNSFSLTGQLRCAPSGHVVYEHCFVCGKCLDNLVNSIPADFTGIITSLRATERYILLLYELFVGTMLPAEVKELRKRCRNNLFSNLFIFKVLNIKQLFRYLNFIAFGRHNSIRL